MKNYSRHSTRLQKHDYSSSGYYFVTICSYKYECIFGKIKGGKIYLDEIGKIVNNVWKSLPNKFNIIDTDQFQIMPNHIHGIVQIKSAGTRLVGASFMKPNNNIHITKTNKHMGLINQTPTLWDILLDTSKQSAVTKYTISGLIKKSGNVIITTT